jgi:alkylated DNA nucleotide flippase Atl1
MPFYQRRYVWGLEKIERLWQDILTVIQEQDGRHYLGSVWVSEIPNSGDMERWTVIDGQQRMTTLSILLCAVRDHVRERDSGLASKIDDLYLINKYHRDDDRRQKVLPSIADRESWRKLLVRQVGADGPDRIGDAYRFFRNALREDEEDGLDVDALESAIAGQLHFVQIIVSSDDNVHRIFESLNDTGEPLSPTDLLRNHVLMRLGPRMEEVYERYWQPMEQLVPPDHLDQLISLSLVFAGERDIAQKDVFHALQAQLRRLPDEAAVEAWVEELHTLALAFQHIVDPATIKDPSVREAVARLVQWGGSAFHAIALRVLAAHKAGSLDSAGAAGALRVVESYLVRRYLVDIEDKDNTRNLRALVRDLGDRVPAAGELTRLLSQAEREFPTDDQVRESLKGRLYRKRVTRPIRYILRWLERDYRSLEPVDMTVAEIDIEHVLPQRPGSAWFGVLAGDINGDETAEDLHAMLVHTLGNLTLTAENVKLGNRPFEEKKVMLADSGFAMNREIARHLRWGRPEIEERNVQLTERALVIWPGPIMAARAQPQAVAVGTNAAPVAVTVRAAAIPAQASAAEPATAGRPARRRSPRDRKLRRVLAAIPAGRWTSFAAIGEAVGVHPAKIPTILFDGDFPNAHRVLKKNGVPSEVFRWPDPARAESQRDVLAAEGVRFSPSGHAQNTQYIGPDDLAE